MKTKLFLKKMKSSFFIAILMLLFSWQANAQTTVSENPVLQAAPNLPKMERSIEKGELFHGEKFTYNKVGNEKALKDWSVNFPSEVVNYKVAIAKYLKDTDVSKLSAANQNTFYDLKSQWIMSIQLIN